MITDRFRSLALRLAPTLCRCDSATGKTCAWNHGLWQFLRLMGLALSPANHAVFYRSAIETVTARRSANRAPPGTRLDGFDGDVYPSNGTALRSGK